MRYQQIAEEVIDDIRHEKLNLGSKMPSIRKMAKQQNVSMTTIINSYQLLEELGWIVSKPQSGFYVARPLLEQQQAQQKPAFPHFLSTPKDLPIDDYCGSMEAERLRQLNACNKVQIDQTCPLGISHVSPEMMPTQALQRCLKREISRMDTALHIYPELQGESKLRRALAQHFQEQSFAFSANDVVVTNGCINAVQLAIETVTQPGDGIAVNSPCFAGLLELLAVKQRRVIELPATANGIDLEQLEQLIKEGKVSAALLSTSHINPLGVNLSVEQKQKLAHLSNHYQFPIIEDDVYIELPHTKHMPLPAKYWDKEGYIMWCSSLSKTLSSGFRLGWCLPGRYKSAYLRTSAVAQMGVNVPTQLGAAEFISSGQYRTHLNKLRTFLALNITEYRQFLMQNLPEGSYVHEPVGGTVLWVEIPGLNSTTFWAECQQQGIDFRVGSNFTSRNLYRNCIRINAGWPLTPTVAAQLKTLCGLAPHHCTESTSGSTSESTAEITTSDV